MESEATTPTRACPDCRTDMKFLGSGDGYLKFKCLDCFAIFYFTVKRIDTRTFIFGREKTAADIIGQHLLKPKG